MNIDTLTTPTASASSTISLISSSSSSPSSIQTPLIVTSSSSSSTILDMPPFKLVDLNYGSYNSDWNAFQAPDYNSFENSNSEAGTSGFINNGENIVLESNHHHNKNNNNIDNNIILANNNNFNNDGGGMSNDGLGFISGSSNSNHIVDDLLSTSIINHRNFIDNEMLGSVVNSDRNFVGGIGNNIGGGTIVGGNGVASGFISGNFGNFISDFHNDNFNYNNNNNNYFNTNITTSTSDVFSTEQPPFELLYRHSVTMTAVYCVAYIIVFIVGLIGNSFVIAVVLRAPRMRTVTNFFIVNLAVADILVIVFCLPATLINNIFVPWMLGWLMCKTVPYIQGVSVAASVYSLIAVSLDRFLAIWWPLKQMTKRRARIMILCIWIIALSSTLPWALFFDLVTDIPNAPGLILCIEVWPPGTDGNLYFLLANLVACYLLPMALITLCYVLIWIKVWTRSIPGDSKDAQMDRMQQKSKVKVVKMLVAVVILFVLSWLPLYVIFARIKLGGVRSAEEDEIINTVTPIAQWLGSSNSCINPILYAFFNKKYRRGFAAIVKSRTCCGRLRYYDNVAIASSSTSTRKSSHYQNSTKKGPCSPSVKSDAVSYIYDHNSSHRKHNIIAKQDSSLSRQMLLKQDSNVSRQSLLKQDSHGSRQMLIKQESCSTVSRQDSNASSRQLLLKHQDSNGSRGSLAKQDSQISYIETKRGLLLRQDSDLSSKKDSLMSTPDSVSIDSRRGILCKQDTQISYLENRRNCLSSQDSIISYIDHKRHQLVKQDSVISFADQKPEPRRHQLVKQDSIISFADQRRGYLTKQDSVIAYPYHHHRQNGEAGHHVSILKKTHSQSSSESSPRKNIEFAE